MNHVFVIPLRQLQNANSSIEAMVAGSSASIATQNSEGNINEKERLE